MIKTLINMTVCVLTFRLLTELQLQITDYYILLQILQTLLQILLQTTTKVYSYF